VQHGDATAFGANRATQPAGVQSGHLRLVVHGVVLLPFISPGVSDALLHSRSFVKVLVIDVGGTNLKLLTTGRRTPRKVPSGPKFTPRLMVRDTLEMVAGWDFDAISIGYPGPVADNRPVGEPANLGKGWVRFDYEKAFGRPVRMMNDAAMQAIGSYEGGRMLFLGLGTGLGTTILLDGTVVPLELAHLPYRKDRSFEDYVGDAGMRALGKSRWRRHVARVVDLLLAATVTDYAVLGGGNVRHIKELPPRTRRGNNANAFRGGFRLWQESSTWR
jgi:polyphosphate glucokinase